MDSVTYEASAGSNTLTMVKRLDVSDDETSL
jgi:hypothetical protein